MLSGYMRDKLVSQIIQGGLYMSLHTADPGLNGASELKQNPYVRQLATGSFGKPNEGTSRLTSDISFRVPKCKVTHVGVWDSQQGGNFIFSGPLDQAVESPAERILQIPKGTSLSMT